MKRSWFSVLALVLGLVSVLYRSASAHSFIDHCTPEVGSTVKQAPSEVRCTFTEAIDAKQTVLAVYDAKNNQVDNKDLKSDPNDRDGKTVVVTLNAAKITNGLYNVKWQTVSADGDPTDGQWGFAVGTSKAPSITIVSPTEDIKFDKAPANVTVIIKANNFVLGQGGRRWQVYLDGTLVSQVTNGATSTTLKSVAKGAHEIKVTLATSADEKSGVATAGVAVQIGPPEPTVTSTITATPTSTPTSKPTTIAVAPQSTSIATAAAPQPQAAPTSGSNLSTILLIFGMGLGVLLIVGVIGVVIFLRRRANSNMAG